MKLTKTKQKHIVMQAISTLDYEGDVIAIVEVDIDLWKERLNTFSNIYKKDDQVFSLEYWHGVYFHCVEDVKSLEKFVKSGENWSYINITEEELESLPLTNERTVHYLMVVNSVGSFYFKGEYKYNDEETIESIELQINNF